MEKVATQDSGGIGGREALQLQISELVHNLETKTTEIAQLRMELKKFKDTQSASAAAAKLLPEDEERGDHNVQNELTALDLLTNPTTFCDDQKQLLLQAQNSASSSSVVDLPQAHHPLGIATDVCGSETDLVDVLDTLLPTSTSDWDKQSSSSISEMSVACLQDRILQMEETHYSTNEELQATLQELTDLQDQLTELQGENEHLAEEKAVLLESLCSQTEKLEDCRVENENLRHLLVQDTNKEALSSSEREMKLLEVLKHIREEKESLESQTVDLRSASESAKEEASHYHEELLNLQEQISTLQATIEASNSSKRILEKQLAESREQLDTLQIEISRIRTQLENERIKVSEMQQAREIVDKSELDELLDHARREKDDLESQAAMLTEQIAFSQCESARHKETISVLQDEIMVTKNNAKKEIHDLEYSIDQLNSEKEQLSIEIGVHRESIHELERKCQRHLEDKRELRATICELKHKLQEANDKILSLEKSMEEAVKTHQQEMQEWKQFQEDLLMTVRVANDFKAEAQEELEGLLLENKHLRERVVNLHAELEKTKQMPTRLTRPASCTESHMLNTVEQEISLQQNRSGGRRDSRPLSVKSLIESIESAAKQVKAQNGGNGNIVDKESDGTSKLLPGQGLISHELSSGDEPFRGKIDLSKNGQEKENVKYYNKVPSNKSSPEPKLSRLITDIPLASGAISETDGPKTSSPISILANKLDPLRRSSYSDILDRKDPLASLVKGGGSKRNALLKWCQNKTIGYKGIDITNFSSSWNDGLAFCALLHTYLSDKIPYDELDCKDKRRNFSVAFKAAESVGIQCNLNINDMITTERPDWQAIMTYVTAIYKHFET